MINNLALMQKKSGEGAEQCEHLNKTNKKENTGYSQAVVQTK